MQALTALLPAGRMRPRPFLAAIAAVYLAGALSHWLTVPDVIARVGLLAFAAVQAALIWLWFVLFAKRLHDAGRGDCGCAPLRAFAGSAVAPGDELFFWIGARLIGQ